MVEKWRDLRRFTMDHPSAADAMIATALLLVAAVGLATGSPVSPGEAGVPPAVWLLVIIGILPLYFRRRAPLAVLVSTSVPIVALLWLGTTPGLLGLVLVIACYSVGAWCSTRHLVAAIGYTCLVLVLIGLLWPQGVNPIQVLENLALFAAAFALGRSARSRRETAALAAQQSALLAAQQAELGRRQVTEERLRIARELHDVVAHSLGVIAVQAGVGRHVLDSDPLEAGRALDAIALTSRESLQEVRGLLGVLRSDTDTVDYEPRASLADLPRLLERARLSGVPVDLEVSGEPCPLPTGVELTACAVIREGLANAVRHAHGAPAALRLDYAPRGLSIDLRTALVPPPGSEPPAPAGSGHGLVGMRERVRLWGGTMTAGATADGGFRLHVELPTGGAGP